MKAKLANIALTTMLVASMFFITIQLSSGGEYDPWIDGNDDGEIDIFDAISLAGAFGTSGNPAKNVSVTNWPTKQTLNVSWHSVLVSEQSSIQLSADVDGYDRLTLIAVKHTSGVLMVHVNYVINGIFTPDVWNTPDLPVGSNFILNDSVVIGPTIWIELTATDFDVIVSLAIYATETSR